MSSTPPSAAPGSRRWLALGLIAAAQFMVIMDTSIIGVALPEMQQDLGFTPQGLSWVFNAYVVAFGGLLLLGGRLSDLLGARRIFSTGWVVLGGRVRWLPARGQPGRRAGRPRRPGRRFGADRTRRPHPAVHHLRRDAQGAHQGPRGLRCCRPRRRYRRRVPRRRPHPVRVLALGVLHQRAARRGSRRADAVGDAGRDRTSRLGRRRRSHHRHPRARVHRLRGRPRPAGRLDLGVHPRRRAGRTRAGRSVRRAPGQARRSRWCGWASSRRRTWRPRTRLSSSWVRPGFRCSSSSTSTCSKCSGSGPSPAVRPCSR